ncbi:MAG: outer membrane lipoprotein-sorting protein [Marinifilaceae bacterium]
MKQIKIQIALAALMLSSMGLAAQTTTGRDVMVKVDNRNDGDNRQSNLTMELINKRGRKRIRSVTSYSMDIGKDKKSIMFFDAPADVKHTAFLTWDYDNPDKDDDRWLYLPAMKKTRRISGSSAKKDYFMGTDFTYDDMGANRNVDEDTHKLLREEKIDGFDCWVVESVPKDSKYVYSKRISWIRKDCLYAHKVDYYDRMGKLLKTLTISEITKVNGIWTAHKMHMKNIQKNHETYLIISNVRYNTAITEHLFTVSNLEKGVI